MDIEILNFIMEFAKNQLSVGEIFLLCWLWREYRLSTKLLDRLANEAGTSKKILSMLDELVQRGRMN